MIKRLLIKILFSILICLPTSAQNNEWALVKIPVACIRDGMGHSTELTSQALMGTPLKILDMSDEWLHIQSPDGYEGYMNISSVAQKSESEMDKWRDAERYVSTSLQEIKLFADPQLERRAENVVTELVMSSILEGKHENDSVLSLTLPDGRKGYAESKYFQEISDWAKRPVDTDSIIATAYWMQGTPYLWGACSTKSVDCSGLVRVCYFANGVLTLRDARQQIDIGKRIEPDDIESLQKGDLLFFSNTPDGHISHVAMYDKDKKYIHSSGRVKTNHMDMNDEDFRQRYYRGASRIKGMENTEGITKITDHDWYFNTASK